MKKNKISLMAISALLTLIAVFATSCEKEEFTEPKEKNLQVSNIYSKDEALSKIKVENGVLCFENEKDYEAACFYILKMEPEEYFDWANQNNFKSLEYIYNEAMESECKLTEYYETLTEEEAEKIEIKDYTDLTLKYVKLGYLKIIKVDDSSSIAVINTDVPELSRILSAENIVCIGNTAIKYFEGNIIKAPIDKLSELKNYENSSYEFSVSSNNTKGSSYNYFKGSASYYSIITNTVKKTRALYKCWFNQRHTSYPYFSSYFVLEIKYQKYVWGKWRDRRTDFTFPATTYKLKMTLSNGSNNYSTESPWTSYIGNTSHVMKYYIHSGYGGNANSYIHTPHIYNGRIRFIVPTVCDTEFALSEKEALK